MKMGGADQQFCLRWNNFHTNITNAFESLRDDEDFVDITLACEGRQVRAHKMVLSACSPYFRNLLKGNPCQHPIVFLKDVTFANLASILDFMYHGEVNVSHNELATFLKTAEALRVRGLAEDDKKKDHENSTDANSPGPSKDPPDPGSPPSSRLTEDHANNAVAASPPSKRRRRRSASPPGGTQSTDEQQGPLDPLEPSRDVKNEPLEDDFSAEDHHHQSDLLGADPSNPGPGLKMDGCDEVEDRLGFALSDSVSVTRNQAAMQQLQDSFPAFLPAITQPSAFLSHNAGSGGGDAQRGSYSMEPVQGLPPGMSTMAGPSMSQASASQDSSSQGGRAMMNTTAGGLPCPHCWKPFSCAGSLRIHIRDIHTAHGPVWCPVCSKPAKNKNALRVHIHRNHRGVTSR